MEIESSCGLILASARNYFGVTWLVTCNGLQFRLQHGSLYFEGYCLAVSAVVFIAKIESVDDV